MRRARRRRARGMGLEVEARRGAATCWRASAGRGRAHASCCARTWTRCRRPRRSSRCSSTTAGRTRNDGILGADNKAAVAMILELARRCSVEGSPVGLELLFTVAEEVGLRGRQARSTPSQLRAEFGYVFDHATPIGEVVIASPTLLPRSRPSSTASAAHAGLRPEAGRSAILAAAHAVVAMPHGRIDDADDRERRLLPRRRRVHQRRRPSAPGCSPRSRSVDADTRRGGARRDDRRPPRRRQPRRVRRRRRSPRSRSSATARSRRRRPSSPPRPRCAPAATSRSGSPPAARRTRTSFEAAGCRASTSPTAPSTTTSRPSASRVAALEGMLDVALALLDEAAAAA